jgi:hypothetical protein
MIVRSSTMAILYLYRPENPGAVSFGRTDMMKLTGGIETHETWSVIVALCQLCFALPMTSVSCHVFGVQTENFARGCPKYAKRRNVVTLEV